MKYRSRNIITYLYKAIAVTLLSLAMGSAYADVIVLENGCSHLASELLGHDIVLGANIQCSLEKAVTDTEIVEILDSESAPESTHLEFDGEPELLSNVRISVEDNVLKIVDTPLEAQEIFDPATHPFFKSPHAGDSSVGPGGAIIFGKMKIIIGGYFLKKDGSYYKVPSVTIKFSDQCIKKHEEKVLECYRGAAEKIYDYMRQGFIESHAYPYLNDQGRPILKNYMLDFQGSSILKNYMVDFMVDSMQRNHKLIQESERLYSSIARPFAKHIIEFYNEQFLPELQKAGISLSTPKLPFMFEFNFDRIIESVLEECKK